VIFREDLVGGRARVTIDEEREMRRRSADHTDKHGVADTTFVADLV